MATYCMSDIHGHKLELDIMLSKIGFSDRDQLYILGDIIDRGYESAEMLMWAVDAPENIHFLIGNHEDVALEVLKNDPVTMGTELDDVDDDLPNSLYGTGQDGVWAGTIWGRNGGEETADALFDLTSATWRERKLLPWLDSLPTHKLVKCARKSYMLVHAGFNPFSFAGETRDKGDIDLSEDGRKHAIENIGYGFGRQSRFDMLWIRDDWIYDYQPAPITTIHGHTPTDWDIIADLREYGISVTGKPGKICRYMNKIDIDCGCAHEAGKGHALGCLRLDDLAEFYVPIIPDEYRFEMSLKTW